MGVTRRRRRDLEVLDRPASHEVVVSEGVVVVIVSGKVVGVGAGGDEGRLGLGSLGLLAALLGSLLGLHLLIAESSQGAGDLLDLVAGEFRGELLGEFLEEEGVVGLLGGSGDDGGQSVAQLLKLTLSRGVEQRKRGNVDSVGRVLGVNDDGGAGGRSLAAVADANSAKHVLGVRKVGLLLGAAETFAALSLSLVLLFLLVLASRGAGGLVLSDALSLGLLVGLGLGKSLGLGLGGLALLLALYFGVFGGIPRIEDLMASYVSGRRRR